MEATLEATLEADSHLRRWSQGQTVIGALY